MRTAFTALALAAAIVLPAQPASASGGWVAFEGTMHISCVGCGTPTPATWSMTGGGVVNGTVGLGSANASLGVFTGATCIVSWTGTGVISGFFDVAFNVTVVGSAGTITTSGDINGAGTITFVQTSPICGVGYDAEFSGSITGT